MSFAFMISTYDTVTFSTFVFESLSLEMIFFFFEDVSTYLLLWMLYFVKFSVRRASLLVRWFYLLSHSCWALSCWFFIFVWLRPFFLLLLLFF